MLDVGQGDALALQWPTGQTLLVDAGGLGEFDVGGRVVTPALWALGVRRLDWLAFTHPDGDHIGGALAVASDLRPREIWEGIPVPKNRERANLARAAAAAAVAVAATAPGRSPRDRRRHDRHVASSGARVGAAESAQRRLARVAREDRRRRAVADRRRRRGVRRAIRARRVTRAAQDSQGRTSRQPVVEFGEVSGRVSSAGGARERRPRQSLRSSGCRTCSRGTPRSARACFAPTSTARLRSRPMARCVHVRTWTGEVWTLGYFPIF